MKYDEIKRGMKVDYHSDITGPVTIDDCIVESDPWQIGHGEWVVLISGMSGGVSLNALTTCKEDQLNKEEIYTEQIKPHIDEIFKICQDNEIDMVAEFYIPTTEHPKLCASSAVIDNITEIPKYMKFVVMHQQAQYVLKQLTDM